LNKPRKQPQSLVAIATAIGVDPTGLPTVMLSGIADLANAGPKDLSYCLPGSKRLLADTGAGAVITTSKLAPCAPCPALVVNNPRLAWAKASHLFAPRPQPAGIHPSALVDEQASLGKNVGVGAGAVVEAQAKLEDGVQIGPLCWIGEGVRIGAGTRLEAGVSCYAGVSIGDNCLVHAGVVIGADGFGFEADASGVWHKIAQLGGVEIGDDVEIGANSTVDSGALRSTRIGKGVKIDNLVQIGHGCVVGDNCLLCAGALVGGSVEMGVGCVLAGNNAIRSGIRLAPGTIVAGSTTLTDSTSEGGVYLGLFPAKKRRDWLQFLRLIARRNSVR